MRDVGRYVRKKKKKKKCEKREWSVRFLVLSRSFRNERRNNLRAENYEGIGNFSEQN